DPTHGGQTAGAEAARDGRGAPRPAGPARRAAALVRGAPGPARGPRVDLPAEPAPPAPAGRGPVAPPGLRGGHRLPPPARPRPRPDPPAGDRRVGPPRPERAHHRPHRRGQDLPGLRAGPRRLPPGPPHTLLPA